MKVISETHHVH